jgi:uncharacterized membrane protein YfcA
VSDALVIAGLVLLGFVVGAYGTMIGAGGGFVLVPVLLLLYPSSEPEFVTSISLMAVFFNAGSGTVAYVRQKRVDFVAANVFAVATIPGAIGGALVVTLIPRHVFDLLFATLLIGVSALLVLRPGTTTRIVQRRNRRFEVRRVLVDAHGDTYVYSYNLALGASLSVIVGFLSSLLGIGGGVVHVPILIQVLHFPAHVATATSHYVLAVSALTGTIVHIATGQLDGGYVRAGAISAGVVVGAQVGALLSRRVSGDLLIRLLGVALFATSLRLLAGALL